MTQNRMQVSRDENYSRYIVRTVFSGKWLPAANEEALRDGEIIIEQVIYKLKVWLRGYLTAERLSSPGGAVGVHKKRCIKINTLPPHCGKNNTKSRQVNCS